MRGQNHPRQKDIVAEKPSIAIVNRSDNTALPARVTAALQTIGFDTVRHITPPRTTARNEVQEAATTTTIADLTGGEKPFSLDELIKKLPAEKSTEQFDTDTYPADFVIVLGTDIIPAYTYTAISQDELENATHTNMTNDDL